MRSLLILFLCGAWFFAACGKDSNVEQGQPAPSAKKVEQETREAYDAAKAYAMTKKEEFRQQAEKTLEFYQKQIDELKLKAEKAKGEARKRFNESVEEWNKKKQALVESLEEMKNAGAEAWEEVEKQINSGMEELKKLYEDARSALA